MNVNLLSENVKCVMAIAPQDINGSATTGDYINMKNAEGVMFLLQLGTVGAAFDLSFNQATAVAGTGAKQLDIKKLYISGASDDNFVETSPSGSGVHNIAATDDNKQVIVEFDASELDVDGGFYAVAPVLADPAAATLASVSAQLYNLRYHGAAGSMPTVITD